MSSLSRLRISLSLLMGLSSLPSYAQGAVLVASEVFQPVQTVVAAPEELKTKSMSFAQRSLQQILFPPMSMTLGEPSAAEWQALQQPVSRHKAFQIGIKRDVPALPDVVDWVWYAVAGGQAGQFTVTSNSALRIRGFLELAEPLPAGVEIRIYAPDKSGRVFGPYSQADFKVQVGGKPGLWVPSLEGDTVGIEVFVPTGISPAQVKLAIPQVSHIAYDMQSSELRVDGVSDYRFASCDVSIACAPTDWQQTSKAVARYIFSDGFGNSYLCSGSLLADKDSSSQIPYFATAAHCVFDATTAGSMDFFWFYRESTCGANDASWTQSSGGADLLASRLELDSTLVRLKEPPPAGVLMSGWALDTLQAGDTVVGIHHGLGNPKQFSQGNFLSYANIAVSTNGYMVVSDPNGLFTQVSWEQGITAPGSSGSGLWKTIAGQAYLKGTLVGGSSSCSDPTSPDEYSRLEKFHPYVKTWLDADGGAVTSLLDPGKQFTALVDGVLVARYLAGKRGSALLAGVSSAAVDMTVLESRLDWFTQQMDVDADGQRMAADDGLLLVRYLTGLRGNALTAGIDLSGAGRNTATAITQYIESLLK